MAVKKKVKKGMTGMKASGKVYSKKGAHRPEPVVSHTATAKKMVEEKPKLSKSEKLTQAVSSATTELRLYKNYNSNYFLLIKEAVKFDYYVSLFSGKIEVLKLPKEEARHLTLATKPSETPKHFAEVMLKSLLFKTEIAVKVLEAVVQNSLTVKNLDLDSAPEGDVATSPLKEANQVKPKNAEDAVPLKKICSDARVEPKLARRILRANGQKPAGRWEWPKAAVPAIMEVLRAGKLT